MWSLSLYIYGVSQRNEAKIKFPANDKNFRSLSFESRVVVVVVGGAGRDERKKPTKNAGKTRATNDKLRMRGQQQQQQQKLQQQK